MGEEDILLELLAEKSADHMAWDQPVKFKGTCQIGCKGRKMLTTKNMLAALNWVEYHREGAEHVGNLLALAATTDRDKLPEVSGSIMLPTDPPKPVDERCIKHDDQGRRCRMVAVYPHEHDFREIDAPEGGTPYKEHLG